MTRSISTQISFADLEFLDQGVRLEPILQAISEFIDQPAKPSKNAVSRTFCDRN